MKNKIFLLSILLIASFTQTVKAQSENSLKETPWLSKQRFYIGGTGGLSFGSVTYVEVAPLVGYRITDRFSVGLNPKYTFIHFKPVYNNGYITQDYKTHIFGGSIFARYFILENIFLSGEYEVNNFEALVALPNFGGFEVRRLTIESLLLGGGYFQKFGNSGSGFSIQVLYDVLQNPYSPYYGIPVIRAGAVFGL